MPFTYRIISFDSEPQLYNIPFFFRRRYMKTDIIKVSSTLEGHEAAIETAERFSNYYNITGKSAMHIRLLTEEALSMFHGIMDDFSGFFWLEGSNTPNGMLCRICLSAEKQINREQESKLLSVSTSGQNVKGIMGKIRELFRHSLQADSSADEDFMRSMTDAWALSGTGGEAYWSLQAYRASISPKTKVEEWDELEKSIIAKLAGEVKVKLKSDVTEIIIEKPVCAGDIGHS